MGDIKIQKKYRDGMFWVRINNGDELQVHPSVWNDPEQRASVIAAEIGTDPQPWMGEMDDETDEQG